MVILNFFLDISHGYHWGRKHYSKFQNSSFWVWGISMVFNFFFWEYFWSSVWWLSLTTSWPYLWCQLIVTFTPLCISFLATFPSWISYTTTIEPVMLRTLLSAHVPISFSGCVCHFSFLVVFFFPCPDGHRILLPGCHVLWLLHKHL